MTAGMLYSGLRWIIRCTSPPVVPAVPVYLDRGADFALVLSRGLSVC